jgi:hypothetical protein
MGRVEPIANELQLLLLVHPETAAHPNAAVYENI